MDSLDSADKHNCVLACQPLISGPSSSMSLSPHGAFLQVTQLRWLLNAWRVAWPSLSCWIVLFQMGLLPSLWPSGPMAGTGRGFAGVVWPAEKTRENYFLCFRLTDIYLCSLISQGWENTKLCDRILRRLVGCYMSWSLGARWTCWLR